MANIFVTGGGSLGAALLRHFNRSEQDILTVYSRNEFNQAELKRAFPEHRFVLGDVRDYDSLKFAMYGHDFVIHTSANKRVPDAEVYVSESINTNILGSLNVARAAVEAEIATVVGVSTDKACEPHSTYGLTKALMERIFAQMAHGGETDFVCVRYGNVLRSRGSIVPLFEEQIRDGGYVTITAPTMTRFWLTMDEAVELVEHAMYAKVSPGSTIIPYAPASTIDVLADAVALSLQLDPSTIEKRILGVRPGEKFHEMLLSDSEAARAYSEDGYMVLRSATDGPASAREALGSKYTSDGAAQLSAEELAAMLAQPTTVYAHA